MRPHQRIAIVIAVAASLNVAIAWCCGLWAPVHLSDASSLGWPLDRGWPVAVDEGLAARTEQEKHETRHP